MTLKEYYKIIEERNLANRRANEEENDKEYNVDNFTHLVATTDGNMNIDNSKMLICENKLLAKRPKTKTSVRTK